MHSSAEVHAGWTAIGGTTGSNTAGVDVGLQRTVGGITGLAFAIGAQGLAGSAGLVFALYLATGRISHQVRLAGPLPEGSVPKAPRAVPSTAGQLLPEAPGFATSNGTG